MSNQILVNYDEVYSKVSEMRRRVQTELFEVNASYRQGRSALNGMDGSANAEMQEAVAASQRKAQVTADTLTKLLSFIDTSTRQVERGEQNIARTFQSANARIMRMGGRN